MTCTALCWTPVPCPTCGRGLQPSGRSISMEVYEGECCLESKYTDVNTRHLFDEHDSTRHYTDPEGWAQHEKECEQCQR